MKKYEKYIKKNMIGGNNKLCDLVLSKEELAFLGFNTANYANSCNNESLMYILDCEMVITNLGQELAAICVIDNKKNILLNELVKPKGNIIDYITHITGYTEETFENIIMTKEKIIDRVTRIIRPIDIIAGHDICSDMKVLDFLNHMYYNFIDTKILFPHSDGPPTFHSLRYLSEKYANKVIQEDMHNAEEDCIAVLDIVNFFVSSGYIKSKYKRPLQLFTDENPPVLSDIETALEVNEENIVALFLKGSRAIGTFGIRNTGKPSDWDYIAVIDDKINVIPDTIIKYGNVDIAIYNFKYFITMCEEQVIWILEAMYVNDPNELMVNKFDFKKYMFDYYSRYPQSYWAKYLISSVGEWKAKKISNFKRFFKENLIYKATKQLFFAYRFVNYGIEIINYKRIRDLSAWNDFWTRLKGETEITNTVYDKYINEIETSHRIFLSLFQKTPRYGGFKENLIKNEFQYKKQLEKESGNVDFNKSLFIRQNNFINDFLLQLVDAENTENKIIQYLYKIYGLNCIRDNYNLILISHNKCTLINEITSQLFYSIVDFNNLKVIASSFDKILNFNLDNKLNSQNLFQVKYNGYLCLMYYYNGKWNVSIKNNQLALKNNQENFLKVWNEMNYNFENLDKNYSYTFEMILKDFPHVIRYEKNNLILLCAKNNQTLKEIDIYDRTIIRNFNLPEIINISQFNVDDILNLRNIEGCIILDSNFNRTKILTKEFLKFRNIGTFPIGTSILYTHQKLLKMVQQNTINEFILYFPLVKSYANSIIDRYNEYITKFMEIYETIKLKSGKEYATEVQKQTKLNFFAGLLFSMKNKELSMCDLFSISETDILYKNLFTEEERNSSVIGRKILRGKEKKIKILDTNNAHIIELLEYLYENMGIKFGKNREKIFDEMGKWFLQNNVKFKRFENLKQTPYYNNVFIVDYRETCESWYDWIRESRGLIVCFINDKWIPIRFMLRRGAELLTGIHISSSIEDTQDIKSKSLKKLSQSQQAISNVLIKGGELDGYLSFKRDGSFMTVTIYTNPIISDIIKNIITTTGDQFSKLVLQMGLEICGLVMTISSLSTISAFHMQSYFVQSILSNYIPDEIIYDIANHMTHNDALGRFGSKFFIDIANITKQLDLTSKNSVTLNFETIVRNRMTAWQYKRLNGDGYSNFHYELAISYEKSSCTFLGIGICNTNNYLQQIPYFALNIDIPFNVPLCWKIKNATDVANIMKSLSDVLYEKTTKEQFFDRYADKLISKQDKNYEIDFEGFVLYTRPDFEYNKIKLVEYYESKDIKLKYIQKLIQMAKYKTAKNAFPNVLIINNTLEQVKKLSENINSELCDIINADEFISKLDDVVQSAITKNIQSKNKIISRTKYFKEVSNEIYNKYKHMLTHNITDQNIIDNYLQYLIENLCEDVNYAEKIYEGVHRGINEFVYKFSELELENMKKTL
jgi:RNA exonuclease 1